MKHLVLLFGVGAVIAGCETPLATTPGAGTAACPVTAARDIEAWVDAMPIDPPTLHARFTVTAPTPGYSFESRLGAMTRSLPPDAIVELTPVAPTGIVTQVLTDTAVAIEIPDLGTSSLKSLTVTCGDDVLFKVTDIVTAV